MEVKTFSEYLRCKKFFPLSVSIGDFDGIHIAHLALIDKMKEVAKTYNTKTAIITFDPHPSVIIKNSYNYTYLTPLSEKIEILSKCDVDYLIIVEFDKQLSQIKPIDFLRDYLEKINVKNVVIGFDFTFGVDGNGKACDIQPLSGGRITTFIMPKLTYQKSKVGTTLIKKQLENGEIEVASKLLGRFYHIKGIVVEGKKIGRSINLPTANIKILDSYAHVKPGVYGVIIKIDGRKYIGLANYGHNPSFNHNDNLTFEVNIINFNKSIYDEQVDVYFVSYIRDEQKFDSIEDFLIQINKDKENIINRVLPFV